MSFGKSKVSRFGEKPDNVLLQRSSATEFPSKSRESARSDKSGGIVSASFAENTTKDEDLQPTSLAEARQKLKAAAAKHCYFGSKIGRPNLKKSTVKPKSAKKVEEGLHSRDSYTTIDTTKSGPPSSRIPSRTRQNSFASRPGSFVTTHVSNKSPDFHKRSLEIQFNMKAKRLNALKRELLEKQKPAIEIYKTLILLRNKYFDTEGKNLPLEELKIVEYPDLKVVDMKQIEKEEEHLKDLKTKLNNSPTVFMDLCRCILDEKCNILDKIFDDDGDWNQDELIRKIQFYKEESVMLEGRIESKLKEEEGRMREMIKEWYQIAKMHIGQVCGPEHDQVNELEYKLQETEHKLKQALADLQLEKTKKNKELSDRNRDLERQLANMREKYHDASKTVDEERSKATSQKERQQVLEHKMKSAKNRMKEAELHKQELEVKIDHLTETIKKNAEEWKTKEMYHEAKHKELQHAVVSHKEEVDKLERERHALDIRVEEMKNAMDDQERHYIKKIQQLELELDGVKSQKATLETEFDVLRVKSVNSELYNHIFSQSKIENEEENLTKTATEMSLWQELKDTKSALKLAEEKIALYADEKTRFLHTINENFEDDANINMTATLIQKEELISTLILQNKQLKETLQEVRSKNDHQCARIKELENKIQHINEEMFQSDVDTEKEIYDLHSKLQYEVNHNKELQDQVLKAQHDNKNIKDMLLDYENLLKIRDGLLNMMQEKRQATEEQNCSLKDYIVQMREQLNLLSIDKSKREQELNSLSRLLEEKTGYIDKIEDRVVELEGSVMELKNKRVMLQEKICNADGELRVTRDKISRLNTRNFLHQTSTMNIPRQPLALHEPPSRENLQQFINHAQNLCSQEALRFRKRLYSRVPLQSLADTQAESLKTSNRPQTVHSCTLEHQRKTKTKIITTVSDIMRKYKSNEGFDMNNIASSTSLG